MSPTRRNFLRTPSLLAAYPLLASAQGFADDPARDAVPSVSTLEKRLFDAFNSMWIADSHEHILDEADRTSRQIDFFDLLSHYTLGDLGNAGLTRQGVQLAMNKQASDTARWAAIEPFWRLARFTGYAQNLRLAIRDIYGFKEISAATIGPINAAIRAKNKPGLYREILKDRARIRFYVQDDRHPHPSKPDREFFVIAREFDDFVTPQSQADLHRLESLTGTSITTLAGLEAALEVRFNEALAAGFSAVKTLLAYQRDIYFAEVERSAAESDFARMAQVKTNPPFDFRQRTRRPFRNLEDFIFHRVMRLANEHTIPVQIHTGLNSIAQGEYNDINNTNPAHLVNLFFLYQKTNFDLFHIGYPYTAEMGALVKGFTHVYVDFCWAHIISPTTSARVLSEYLDTVPSNKILGFGGDFLYVELTYAHAKIARRNIARVLAAKVLEGFCNEGEALELGKRMLFDNVAALFYPSLV